MESVPFLVVLPTKNDKNDEMGILGIIKSDADIGMKQIPVDVLKNNLATIAESMLNVLEDVKRIGQYKLKEVTMNIEVSANGGVSIIGTANIGGKGAISLKFAE